MNTKIIAPLLLTAFLAAALHGAEPSEGCQCSPCECSPTCECGTPAKSVEPSEGCQCSPCECSPTCECGPPADKAPATTVVALSEGCQCSPCECSPTCECGPPADKAPVTTVAAPSEGCQCSPCECSPTCECGPPADKAPATTVVTPSEGCQCSPCECSPTCECGPPATTVAAPSEECPCSPCVCAPAYECVPPKQSYDCFPAYAYPEPDCCDDLFGWCDAWIDGIEVRARFILWKPCFDDLDYAYGSSTEGTTIVNEYKYVSHNWKPGFELAFGKDDIFCGLDAIASYVYITGADKDTASSLFETLFPTQTIDIALGTLLNASSRHEFSYQTIELLFSRHYTLYSCHHVTPLFGVEGLILSQQTDTKYETTTNDIDQVSWSGDYSGFGFKMGAQYDYALNACTSFYFKGAGMIVAGDLNSVTRQEVTGNTPQKWKANESIVLPGYHIGVGFLYDFCWRGKIFTLSLGYEFLEWYNVPQQPRDDIWSQSHGQLGLHGIQTGLTFCF